MSLNAGTISLVSKGATTIEAVSTVATGEAGPHAYQWYKHAVGLDAGFTPIQGATSLELALTGLEPSTQYELKVVVTDANTITDDSKILSVMTEVSEHLPSNSDLQKKLKSYDRDLHLVAKRLAAIESQLKELYPLVNMVYALDKARKENIQSDNLLAVRVGKLRDALLVSTDKLDTESTREVGPVENLDADHSDVAHAVLN